MNAAIRKGQPGRPKKTSGSKSRRILSLAVDIGRLKVYQDAANKGFRGDLSDFLLAAADDFAARVAEREEQLNRDRDAFLRAAAGALNAHLVAKAKRDEMREAPHNAAAEAPTE